MSLPYAQTSFKKVLIIDDNETDRYVSSHLIKKNDFAHEVETMATARLALNYLRTLEAKPDELPDLIFLDIRMPEMDGFGFLDEYNQLPDTIRLKCVILMLSTSLNIDDHQRAEGNSHVVRFVNKPLSKEKLDMLKKELLSTGN